MFFPGQEEPEEDGTVWCFQALETDGNKLHLKMYLGKKKLGPRMLSRGYGYEMDKCMNIWI